jgi:flavodoxin I
MKSLVIYDSLYGNTEKIAHIIGNTIGKHGVVEVVRIGTVKPGQLAGNQLLVVGSPTQQFRPTASMKNFLISIPKNGLLGIKVAAFDTRLTMSEIEKTPPLSFFVKIYGYAAARIANQLKKKGGELVIPAEGFFVEGMKGPLVEGELERAEKWASGLLA